MEQSLRFLPQEHTGFFLFNVYILYKTLNEIAGSSWFVHSMEVVPKKGPATL